MCTIISTDTTCNRNIAKQQGGPPLGGRGRDFSRRCISSSDSNENKRVWKRQTNLPPGEQLPSMFAASNAVPKAKFRTNSQQQEQSRQKSVLVSTSKRSDESKNQSHNSKKNPVDPIVIENATATKIYSKGIHLKKEKKTPTAKDDVLQSSLTPTSTPTPTLTSMRKPIQKSQKILTTPKSNKKSTTTLTSSMTTPKKITKTTKNSQYYHSMQSPTPATPSTVASADSWFSPNNSNSSIGFDTIQSSPVASVVSSPSQQQRRYVGSHTPKSAKTKQSKVISVFSKIPKLQQSPAAAKATTNSSSSLATNFSPNNNNNNNNNNSSSSSGFALMTPQEQRELVRSFRALEEENLRNAKPIDISVANDAMDVLRKARTDNEFLSSSDDSSSGSENGWSSDSDDSSVDISSYGSS